jgi:hypothetical protein
MIVSKQRVQKVIRNVVSNSGGDMEVAMRRLSMCVSANPSLQPDVIEYALELFADQVLARNPNLSEEEGVTEILGTLKQNLVMEKEKALFDAALAAHPDWEKVGDRGVRYVGKKKRFPKCGPANVVEWFYINHPRKARQIEKQFSAAISALGPLPK